MAEMGRGWFVCCNSPKDRKTIMCYWGILDLVFFFPLILFYCKNLLETNKIQLLKLKCNKHQKDKYMPFRWHIFFFFFWLCVTNCEFARKKKHARKNKRKVFWHQKQKQKRSKINAIIAWPRRAGKQCFEI